MKNMSKTQINRFFLITILFLIKGLTMVQAAETKLYYGVDIDLHNVGVDIRVNDIPVFFDDNKGQLIVEVPAPDSIVDGDNILSVKAFLPYDGTDFVKAYAEGAYVTVTLFKQGTALISPKKINLSRITLKFDNSSAITIVEDFNEKYQASPDTIINQDKSLFAQISTKISSPFPRWAWQDGKMINNSQETYASLLVAYKDVYDALQSKSINDLKMFYSERSKETAIAYHLADEEAGHHKLSVGDDMNNDKLELYDLHTDGLELQILGAGRLARLADDIGAQPILYTQKDGAAVHLYKFMFYLNSNEKWVLIR